MLSRNEAASSDDPDFLTGGGEMRALMRAHDWQSTSLGDPETWPQALRSAVQICLNTPIVGAVLWGADLSTLYNDVYAPALAERHPWALGRPFSKVWAEIWDVLGPQIASVIETGRGFSTDHQLLRMERNGRTENTYWIYSFAPLYDGNLVAGILVTALDTTERVKADQDFTRLFQASPAPFLVLRPDTPNFTIAEVNDAYLAATMTARDGIVGRPLFEAFPDNPDDADADGVSNLRASLDRVLDTRKPDAMPDQKYDIAGPDGSFEERWWSPVNSPVPDEHGKVAAIIHKVTDVTEDRRMQAALRDSEERLRLAVDNAEVGFWDVDLIHDELIWPQHTKAMFGISPEVPVTMADFYDGLHPDDRDATSDAFAAAADPARRELYDVEYRTVGKEDGIVRWVAAKGRGVFDETGRCLRVTGTAIDLSARMAADAALRASEAAARVDAQRVQLALAAGAIIGTWFWDIPTDTFTADEPFARAVGMDPMRCREGIPLADIFATVHPDDQAGLAEAIAAATVKGGPYARQYRVRRTDGKYYWIEANGHVDNAPDGTPLNFPGVLIDVEGRRAVEAERDRATAALRALTDTLEQRVAERTGELMQTEEALRQAQKMEAVGQLTGGLAHDFNNLLTGMMGNLELLQTRVGRGRLDDIDRFINAAQGAGRRAASLTQRLLAFSRRQTLDPRPTDVNRLIAGIEELLRRTVGGAAQIEVVGAAGLWAANIDAGQLENALLNLCINARDAMPDGGRIIIETANKWLDERTAKERELSPGQYVSVCVTDTGAGMSAETIERAFEPFYTTKPTGQGTGLGLSMIYGFARQSGGQVRIYSELDQGTTVCIYLPRHFGDADDVDMVEIAHALESATGQTILVVDDEPTIRHLIDEVLDEAGYTVINAADGASGLRVLESGAQIELLITDVGLPNGMNGRQVADAARALRPGLKVLFITGYAENAAVGNGHLEPGMELLTKPFSMDALAAKVGDMMKAKGSA